MDVAKKAWGTLLEDVIAVGVAFKRKSHPPAMRSRVPGKKSILITESCGHGFDHEEGQQLTGMGRAWLTGQYHKGSTLGSSPAEARAKFFSN